MAEITKQDRLDWHHQMGIIRKTEGGVVEWCKAALKIKTAKLYLVEHKTWEDFCRRELGKTREHVTRLLRDLPMLDAQTQRKQAKAECDARITSDSAMTERARNAVRKVPEDQREAVLEAANEAADRDGSDSLTDKHVEAGIRALEPVHDLEGAEAPQALADVFAMGMRLKELANMAAKIGREAREMGQQPGGAFVQTGTIGTIVSRLKRELLDAAPWAICPECAGAACLGCGKRGWFTREQIQQVSE